MPHWRLTSPTPAPGRRHGTGRHLRGGSSTISTNTYDIYVAQLVVYLSLPLARSLHRQVCVRCLAPLRQFVSNVSVGRRYILVLQRWFKVGCRGMGEGHRGTSPERVGPVRCLPTSPWTSGCSRAVPGRLGAGRAGAELTCVT